MTKFHCHREGEEKLFFSVCCCFLLVSFCSRCMFLFSLLFKAGFFVVVCLCVGFVLFVCLLLLLLWGAVRVNGGGEGGGCEHVRWIMDFLIIIFLNSLYILKLAYLLTMFKIYCSLIRGFEFLLAIAYLPKYSPYPQHCPPPPPPPQLSLDRRGQRG